MSTEKREINDVIPLPGGKFIARGTVTTLPGTKDGLRVARIVIEQSIPNPTVSLNIYAAKGPNSTPFGVGNFSIEYSKAGQTIINALFSNTETDDNGPLPTKVEYDCDYIIIG
jgi:hypothetical protein